MCRVWRVFVFNDTATTEIYTLSLHDALPISPRADQDQPERCPQEQEGRPQRARLLAERPFGDDDGDAGRDRKSTRLNSSHANISYAVFCLKNKTPPSPTVKICQQYTRNSPCH